MAIYSNFCTETLNEKGGLEHIELHFADDFNFGYDVVDAIAASEPDKVALVWCNTEGDERIFTFKDIRRESNRMANTLAAAGIGSGSRIMLVLKRHYEYWFAAIALHKLGAVMIPATHMLTEKDFAYRIRTAELAGVICTLDDGVPYKISGALRLCDDIERPLLFTVRGEAEGFSNLTAAMRDASETFARRPTCVDDPMVIYFTSGTTGDPKAVIHDFAYPLAHIVTAKYWQRVHEGGLHFTVAETGWAKASWGKLYGQWLCGCAVMVYDFDNFEPKQLVNVINRYGVTSFCAPPTVYRYLVRKGIPAMPSLKQATTAGEMLSAEVFRRFYELTGLELREGYGQTETTLLTANFESAHPGALGIGSPFYNIDLRRKDGSRADVGEIGELVILPPERGRQVGIFRGYLGCEEQYEHVWCGGVYHTGDAAYRDADGVYHFHGRFDDIIKTGGYRIGPYEVENVLMEHPAVLECSVVGIPDPLRGQAIKAIIVLNSGFTPCFELEKAIREFTNARLAEYKWIRIVEFAAEMPKTISGKVRKSLQREGKD